MVIREFRTKRECLPFKLSTISEMDSRSWAPHFLIAVRLLHVTRDLPLIQCPSPRPGNALRSFKYWELRSGGPHWSVIQHVLPHTGLHHRCKLRSPNPFISLLLRGHLNWLQLDRRVLEHDFPKKSGPVVLYFCVRYVYLVSILLLLLLFFVNKGLGGPHD